MRRKNSRMISKLFIWMMVLLVASSQLMILPSATYATEVEMGEVDIPIEEQEVIIDDIPAITIETYIDEHPELPSVVEAIYSDSTTSEVAVTWNSVEPSDYAQVGTFNVEGSAEGTDIKAEAIISVMDKEVETPSEQQPEYADMNSFLEDIKANVPDDQEVVSYSNNYQSMEPEAMTFVNGNGTASVNNGLVVAISDLGKSGAVATWDKAPWISSGMIDITMRYTSTTQGNVGFVIGSNGNNQGMAIRYDAGTEWVIQSPDGTSKWETFVGPELKMDTDYHIQIGYSGTKLLVNVDNVTYYNKDAELLWQMSGLGQIGLYKRYATGEISIDSLRIEGVGTKDKPSNIVNYTQDYEDPNYTPNWSGLNAAVMTDLTTGNRVLSLKKGTGERGVDLDSPQIEQGTLSMDFKLVNPEKLGSGQGFAFGFRMNDNASIFNELGVDPSSWIPESNKGWGTKQEIPYPIQGRWNNLMFNFKGKTITVYLNKKLIGDITFDQFSEAAGRLGLRIRSTVELQIDNVQYTNEIIEPKQIAQYSNDFQDGIKGTWNGADSTLITEGSNRVLKLSNIKGNVMNMDAPSLHSATYMVDVKPATKEIGFVIGDGAVVKYDGSKWMLNKDGESTDFVASDSNQSSPSPYNWNKVGIQYADSSVTLSINGAELQANLAGGPLGEGRFGVLAQDFIYIDNVVFTEEFLEMNTSSSNTDKLRYEAYYEGDSIVNWTGFNSTPQVSNGYLQGTIDAGIAAINEDVSNVPNGIYQVKMQADGAAGVKLGNITIYEDSAGNWKYKQDDSGDVITIGNAEALESGKDYTLRVEMIENKLGLYVNGIMVGSASVDGYAAGSFGIYNAGAQAIQVKIDAITAEEIRVYAPDYSTQNWGPLDSSKPEVLRNGNGQIVLNMPGVSSAVDKDSPKFADQHVNFDVQTNVSAGADGGRYGFILRGSAADKYIGVVHDINGKWKVTASTGNEVSFPNTYQMQANTNYHIELRLVGTMVNLAITGPDGVTTDMGSVSEETLTAIPGWFGLRSWYGTKQMTVSNLKLVELESLPKLKLAQETDTIKNGDLTVTVYKDFPGIVDYQVDQHTLQADVEQTNSLKINNKDYVPRTVSKKVNDSKYQYTMTFDEIGVVIDGYLEVKANQIVRFEMDKITENSSFLVRSIQMNNSLIHVNSSMEDATYAWSKSDGAWHGITEEIVDDMSNMKQSGTAGVTMAMVSGEGLGASVENNVMSGGNKLLLTLEKKPLVNKLTVKPGSWTYRHLQSSETEALPWYEVVVTGERNNDGKTDWQDATVAYRTDIYQEPFGAQDIKNNMMYIAFNFASQANDPFVNSLDTGKVLYNYTDGFGQMVLHKGYQAEGHDDDIPSYSNIGVRQGGVDDFNYLINEGKKYNLNIGVHLNATEYQLDANELKYSNLSGATSNGPKTDRLLKGWDWIDTAYYVDQTKDVLSGELNSRFTNLYNLTKDSNDPNDPTLDFFYVDVYTGNDYNAYKLLQYANDLGIKIGTEFAGPLEPGSTFVHWGPDLGYPNKGNNSILSRMVKNNLDIFVGNALFKGQKIPVVTTWGDSKPDLQQGVTVFFNEVLPTKFMQHFGVLKYEKDQVTFDNEVVSKRNNGKIELTKNGKLISSWKDTGTTTDESVRHTGEANSLIPWVWDIKTNKTLGASDGAKLYHWNTTGDSTTWELTDEFKDVSQFNMYELTQQGKVLVDTMDAQSGILRINKAKKNTPYVLYPASAEALNLVPSAGNWGEGSLIKDFAFNSEEFNVPGSWTVDDSDNITIKTVQGDTEYDTTKEMNRSNWNRYAEVGSEAGVISQEITGLQPGQDYTVGVWTQTENGRTSSLQVTMNGETYSNEVTGKDGLHQSSFKYVDTKWQRMSVEFKVPAGITTATVQLVADAGAGTVQFDDVRIWKHTTVEKDPTNQGYVVHEDFENVYEGWGPFEYGGGSRQIHIASDRSNPFDNNPIVQPSENEVGPVMTWVLDGENSLKVNETDIGKLIKTNESSVKLNPNTEYDLGFIYTLEKSAGYEVSVQSRSTGEIVLKETLQGAANPGNKAGEDGGYKHFQKNFTTGDQDDYQVIFKMVTKGASGPTSDYAFILDNFYIKAKSVDVSKELLQEAIAYALTLKSSDYTDETWANVAAALEQAQKIFKDPSATVASLDAARVELDNAVAGLVLVAVNIIAIEEVQLETVAGTAPSLPKQVTVTWSDHTTQKISVAWDAIDPSHYAQAGTFKVKGSVDGTDMKAIATVKVKAKDSSNPGTTPGTDPGTGSNPDHGSNPSPAPKPEVNPKPDPGTGGGSDTGNEEGNKPGEGNNKPKVFVDTVGHWASKHIEALVSRGIIMGVSEQKFAPNMTINRSEIAAMLTRALGLKAGGSNVFKDVAEDKWYKDAISAAADAGLLQGYAGNVFAPTKPLSREEMAVIIVRVLEMKGKLPEVSDTTQQVLSKYKDGNKPGNWSKKALAICIELGLIQGTPDQKLNPKSHLTRAEAAVLFNKLLTIVESDENVD